MERPDEREKIEGKIRGIALEGEKFDSYTCIRRYHGKYFVADWEECMAALAEEGYLEVVGKDGEDVQYRLAPKKEDALIKWEEVNGDIQLFLGAYYVGRCYAARPREVPEPMGRQLFEDSQGNLKLVLWHTEQINLPPPEPIIWTDKEGQDYTESQITNEHLENIIVFLAKVQENIPLPPYYRGEEAWDLAQQAYDSEYDRLDNLIEQFETVAEKRRLDYD